MVESISLSTSHCFLYNFTDEKTPSPYPTTWTKTIRVFIGLFLLKLSHLTQSLHKPRDLGLNWRREKYQTRQIFSSRPLDVNSSWKYQPHTQHKQPRSASCFSVRLALGNHFVNNGSDFAFEDIPANTNFAFVVQWWNSDFVVDLLGSVVRIKKGRRYPSDSYFFSRHKKQWLQGYWTRKR